MDCACFTAKYDDSIPLVQAFGDVRENCLALSDLLAPDDAWPLIAADASGPPNRALHRSFLLLAFQRGCLAKITGPVHRFLFEGRSLRAELTDQYRRDLPETWLSETEEVERHERFRRFLGKIVELQVAEWLTLNDWVVSGLAALGAESDIEGSSPGQRPYSVEVKYIGQQTADFQQVVNAIAGQTAVGSMSLYGAINYLLFRVYEAARGLRRQTRSKLVVIVVDAQAWHVFNLPLQHNWLDWKNPAFLPTTEGDWNQFIQEKRRRYPNIDTEIPELVQQLEGVWIVLLKGGYEYSLEYEYRVAG